MDGIPENFSGPSEGVLGMEGLCPEEPLSLPHSLSLSLSLSSPHPLQNLLLTSKGFCRQGTVEGGWVVC